jgi:NADH-quinone oxidoreductase subunit M
MSPSHLLSLVWVIPAALCVITALIPEPRRTLVKVVNAVGSGLNVGLVVYLLLLFRQVTGGGLLPGGQPAFMADHPWFTLLNIHYTIGVDALSLLMMLLTAIIIFCGVFASWSLTSQVREFFILMNVLVTGVYGVFISLDLFTLFFFYEVAVLPMYLLIGIWGTGRKEYGAMKLTLMLVAASALIFGGILALYFESGLKTFNLLALSGIHFDPAFQRWAFPVIFIGFGVLGAMFPFHTWSPDGHASAPTAVSMLHAGVLMKLGGYGCLRVAMFLLPEGAREWMPVLLALVTVNVVVGAFIAIRQTDLKYITAYSSVSHCGLVLFGLLVLTPVGLKGACLQMLSHGLLTALFFCLIGLIYGRTHTREIDRMGGLMSIMPFLGVAFVIAGFAGLGLPSLSGFVAEITIFLGAFANPDPLPRVCVVLAVLSITTTAIYVIRAANRMLNGPLPEAYKDLTDASPLERVPVLILLACLFGMGLFPGWMMDLLHHSLEPIVAQLNR